MNKILNLAHKTIPGKVATIKLSSGMEIVGKVIAIEESGEFITMHCPMVVVISGGDTAIVPYQYTGTVDEVTFCGTHVLSIVETAKVSAEDYSLRVESAQTQ